MVILLLLVIFGGGCTNREFSRTPRTGTEQLLLSHALERSVNAFEAPAPLPASATVEVMGYVGARQILEPALLSNGPMINSNIAPTSGPESTEPNPPLLRPTGSELVMMRGFVEGRLAELGYAVVERREDADLWVRVMVLALGTDQGQNFFGLPAIQSMVIPFSTPALTLYAAQRQIAYVRYRLQVYDRRTRQWHLSGNWHEGSAYYNQYTVLFFINFRGTDMLNVPVLQ
jgi:hypothetical protein